MQIQINSDNSIELDEQVKEEVRKSVEGALDRFADRITRVEVHLHDENGAKGGVDTRCVIEARVSGVPPVAVEEQAETVQGAVKGASGKLVRMLDTRFGRARGF